jgi:hypothetical protein
VSGRGDVRLVTIALPTPLATVAAHHAEAHGIPLSRWCGEIVESFVASARCHHPVVPRDAPFPDDRSSDADA